MGWADLKIITKNHLSPANFVEVAKDSKNLQKENKMDSRGIEPRTTSKFVTGVEIHLYAC